MISILKDQLHKSIFLVNILSSRLENKWYIIFFCSPDYKTGFGGQYGVQSDRVDKSAVGWEHHEELQKHESQKDYSKGFGGKYGVQTDRKDKVNSDFCALKIREKSVISRNRKICQKLQF